MPDAPVGSSTKALYRYALYPTAVDSWADACTAAYAAFEAVGYDAVSSHVASVDIVRNPVEQRLEQYSHLNVQPNQDPDCFSV
jgi:hypothetical protein